MSSLRRTLAAAALSLATLAPAGYAAAADLPVKAMKKVAPVPFFLVIDDRVSFSWMPKGTDPGLFSVNPNGSINGTTAKQVYSFTHFDAWAYGTNFFTISMFKSGHNDPASPCINVGVLDNFAVRDPTFSAPARLKSTVCSARPSASTKSSIPRPSRWARCITFRSKSAWTATAKTTSWLRPSATSSPGLQFAFDLPYKGYFNLAPLVYWEYLQPQRLHPVRFGNFAGNVPGLQL